MTFLISDKAAERMVQFIHSYRERLDSIGLPGPRYGGAFWPRYEGEGSGCSAFVISLLDIAGILREEYDNWQVKIDIPIELVGGPYNDYNKVRLSDIKKSDDWNDGSNPDSASYVHLELFDPTLIYEWIFEKRDGQDRGCLLPTAGMEKNNALGIWIDVREVAMPEGESLFLERENPSIFIDYYHQKFLSGQ
jgi:hypothetical protein